MRYFNNYNPYKFILLIPFAIIAGLVYYLISSWRQLDNTTLIILILIIFITITFLGYKISKENHPLRGMRHERGDIDDIVQKIIEKRKGALSDQEILNLRLKAKNIYDSTYRRGERTMRIKMLMDEYLNNNESSKKIKNNGKGSFKKS